MYELLLPKRANLNYLGHFHFFPLLPREFKTFKMVWRTEDPVLKVKTKASKQTNTSKRGPGEIVQLIKCLENKLENSHTRKQDMTVQL